ncbi:MAG: hypothetical protein HWE27_05620 [Gammaproteobacteria bacterium]|nr:hypothetical protein [Gammaproteobacteria bacterium]
MKAVREYSERSDKSKGEVESLILKPEDNSFPAHGLFSQGEGDEVSDIHDLLDTRPTDDNFIMEYWNKRQEAKRIFNSLEPAAHKVAKEIIEEGIDD